VLTQEGCAYNISAVKLNPYVPILMSATFGALNILGAVWSFPLASATKEHSLPDRTVTLPASKSFLAFTKAQAEAGGAVVYAKEPIPFDPPTDRGSYYLYGYVGASQALSAPVAVYLRAKDPSEDPACKVLVAPSAAQNGDGDSSVHVCGEGQDDLRVALVVFAGTSLSSFCSTKNTLQENPKVDASLLRDKFWIGIRWTPLFPHPLAFSFSNVAAYGPLPSSIPSLCAPTYCSR
jgi:hypothetical protein